MMISEIDFLNEHLIKTEKDFKELILLVEYNYEIECEYADKLNKAQQRQYIFYNEK